MGLDMFGFGEETKHGERLREVMAELENKYVRVGWTEKSGAYEDGVTVAQIAVFNEFGTEHIPSRPMLRQTSRKYADDIEAFQAEVLEQMVDGMDTESGLNAVGAKVKGMIQKEIRNGNWVANKPSTIKRKGSSSPLIDTGRMRQSVVYEIKEE